MTNKTVKELVEGCETPIVDLLQRIPMDQRLEWTETDGLKAHHFVAIGVLAHKAATTLTQQAAEIEALRGSLVRVQDEAGTVCGDWRETASMIDSICITALTGGGPTDG